MLSLQLILELCYWAPLIALLLSSLSLIGLKRVSGLSPWAQRLVAPPFYFVAVPIATLLAGLELVTWSVFLDWFSSYHLWGFGITATLALAPYFFVDELSLGLQGHPVMTAIAPFAFCAAMFAGGYSLWQSLWRKERLNQPFNKARHVWRALVLLLALAWVFFCNRSFILFASTNLEDHLRHVW